ncbi:MAG: phosphoenolpyruvate--protein phosphotransferase, partial [Treponema sp.]|nr:phosphoenolpyruvate--protein phosphotransferase [Treponema sp.]
GLNIGGADEQELAGEAYTDLVGLFRTEFLYMGRDTLPSEEEQFTVYKKILQRYGRRPVTLRTLDIGGDKTLSSMNLPKEDNPVLGNRALRLCFTCPEVFKTQLRAALRASVFGNLWLMLPMVSSIDDIRRAKTYITEARGELDVEGVAYNKSFKIGIMVEIPSIAVIADLAAKEVDFASIGTNDLCQYLTAVDRMNPQTASYYQTYHPGMFRLIGTVVEQFNRAGKPICVCGEMGGDVLAAPVLVGLGMRKLSMGLASVARIKRVLASLTVAKAEELAGTVINLSTAHEVERYLNANL